MANEMFYSASKMGFCSLEDLEPNFPKIEFVDDRLIKAFYKLAVSKDNRLPAEDLKEFTDAVTETFQNIVNSSQEHITPNKVRESRLRVLSILVDLYRMRQTRLDRWARNVRLLDIEKWSKIEALFDKDLKEASLNVSLNYV